METQVVLLASLFEDGLSSVSVDFMTYYYSFGSKHFISFQDAAIKTCVSVKFKQNHWMFCAWATHHVLTKNTPS